MSGRSRWTRSYRVVIARRSMPGQMVQRRDRSDVQTKALDVCELSGQHAIVLFICAEDRLRRSAWPNVVVAPASWPG